MFQDVHHYHTIEIDKDHKLPELTGDLRESIKALVNHPGFQYLLARFRHQKAAMETSLREGFNLTDIQLRFLQAGTFWAAHFDREIKTLTQSAPKPAPPTPNEREQFEKIRQSIDLIGS
jgi:hypothetical protein